ncbi:MAG TPA: hypothetical protein VHZ28_10855 [Terracidiphilus sp.]|jgi:hypothetical protein|nr:hypothetical protein [Terracidiphilus sp.]
MENPHLGQRVWAEGLQGTFSVVRIDDRNDVVDLELITDPKTIEKNIPMQNIHALGAEFSKAPPRKPDAMK